MSRCEYGGGELNYKLTARLRRQGHLRRLAPGVKISQIGAGFGLRIMGIIIEKNKIIKKI